MSSPDNFQQRYIDELIAASNVLPSVETAAQAEAWVSGAVAEWRALDGRDDALESEARDHSPLVADLLRWFGGGERPTGALPWIDDLGRHELTRVLCLADPSEPDEQALIFEYELDGEADHDVSVSISHGALVGASVGPAGLAEGIGEELDSSLTTSEMDPTSARDLAAAALSAPLDQLSPASEANVPLLARRMGAQLSQERSTAACRPLPERDVDDDAWCVGVVRSALRAILESPAPATVEVARTRFADVVAEGVPDALTVLEVAGADPTAAIDLQSLLRAVGAYFNPVDLAAHTDAQFAALIELEPVDWAGVVLGVVRSPAAPIDGSTLVTHINRAPEITSSIPKSDAPRIAWTFEQMLFAWEVTGVLDGDGQVTEPGRWLLAHAFVQALSA